MDATQNADLLAALEIDADSQLPAFSVEGVVNADVYPMPKDWAVESENVDVFVQGILRGKASGGRKGLEWVEKAGLKARAREEEKMRDEL